MDIGIGIAVDIDTATDIDMDVGTDVVESRFSLQVDSALQHARTWTCHARTTPMLI